MQWQKWLVLILAVLLLYLARRILPPFIIAGVIAYLVSPLVVAKAYADFSEHDGFRRRLDAAGIESEHYPLKLTNGRRQSSADLHMVIDIMDTVLDRPR